MKKLFTYCLSILLSCGVFTNVQGAEYEFEQTYQSGADFKGTLDFNKGVLIGGTGVLSGAGYGKDVFGWVYPFYYHTGPNVEHTWLVDNKNVYGILVQWNNLDSANLTFPISGKAGVYLNNPYGAEDPAVSTQLAEVLEPASLPLIGVGFIAMALVSARMKRQTRYAWLHKAVTGC